MPTPSRRAELNAVKPLPHGQAIEFWKKRLPLSPEDYRALGEMSLEAQTRAFAVADISSIDALMTIHDALGEALKHGESFGDFKKRIREQITANGWGRKRVATIYRTNIQTAYNVGHWKNHVSNGMEVLVYDAVGDSRTRPTHAALDGKAFRIDDDFWDTWYPPNGFGCRCTTQGMSLIEAEARGITIEKGSDPKNQVLDLPNMQTQPLIPDPGFAYNPGKTVFGDQPNPREFGIHAEKLDLKQPTGLKPWAQLPTHPAPPPVAITTLDDAQRFIETEMMGARGFRDYSGKHLVVFDAPVFVRHSMGQSKKKFAERVGLLPLIKPTIEDPDECWFQVRKVADGRYRLNLVYFKKWQHPSGKISNVAIPMDWVGNRWKPVGVYHSNDIEERRIGYPFRRVNA